LDDIVAGPVQIKESEASREALALQAFKAMLALRNFVVTQNPESMVRFQAIWKGNANVRGFAGALDAILKEKDPAIRDAWNEFRKKNPNPDDAAMRMFPAFVREHAAAVGNPSPYAPARSVIIPERTVRDALARGELRDTGPKPKPVALKDVPELIVKLSRESAEVEEAVRKAHAGVGKEAVSRLNGALAKDAETKARVREALAGLDAQAVPLLIKALDDAHLRQGVVYALGRIGDMRAAPHLIRLLSDRDEELRAEVAAGLGGIKDPKAAAALAGALRDRSDFVRENARLALVEIGAPAIPVLINALREKNAGLREQIFMTLTAIGGAAVQDLAGLLKGGDEDLRRRAAAALGKIKDPVAAPALAGALKDKDAGTRSAAARSLGEMKAFGAISALVAALGDRNKDVENAAGTALASLGEPAARLLIDAMGEKGMRNRAAQVLTLIGEPAVPYLIGAFRNADRDTRAVLARTLEHIGRPAFAALIEALDKGDVNTRRGAAMALNGIGRIGDRLPVPALAKASLEDKDAEVRRHADEALKAIGGAGEVPGLIIAIRNGEVKERRKAASKLIEIGDARATDALLLALKDGDRSVRELAVRALGHIGDLKAVPGLISALDDAEAHVRSIAAVALGGMKDAKALPALLRRLRDEDADVRAKAVEALGEVAGANPANAAVRNAIAGLMAALKDGDRTVRRNAAVALAGAGGMAAGPLVKALRDKDTREIAGAILPAVGIPGIIALIEGMRDKNEERRQQLIQAFRHFGGDKVPQPIREAAAVFLTRAMDDPDQNVRRSAVLALGAMRDPGASGTLLMALLNDGDPLMRRNAADALGMLADAGAVRGLVAALHEENADVAERVVRALSDIGPPAVPALLAALKDESRLVRRRAARALGRSGNRGAVAALIETMQKDTDWLVRGNATAALAAIGPMAAPELIKLLRIPRMAFPAASYTEARERATSALLAMGSEAVLNISDALREGDGEVRRIAAGLLGRIRDQQAVPALIKALDDKDREVREVAARSLGLIRHKDRVQAEQAVAALHALSEKDAYASVREAAAEAVRRIRTG